MKIKVLGTKYSIEKATSEKDIRYLCARGLSGVCIFYAKRIVVFDKDNEKEFTFLKDMSKDERDSFLKATIRHELVHAYLFESGLDSSSDISEVQWARNEEMIDWIALQSPKLYKTFKKLGLLNSRKNLTLI